MSPVSAETPFYAALREAIDRLGGLYNAHLHLDRAGTLDLHQGLADAGRLALSAKHQLIPAIHAGAAYDPPRLRDRTRGYLQALARTGSRRAATLVDVTLDRVGLSALDVFLELKAEFAPALALEVGAYSPLGFRDDEPERWDLLRAGARRADFIGSLPERDDRVDYPEHIGFGEHCRRILSLAAELDRSVHMHADQRNHPLERGAEIALEVVEELKTPPMASGEPRLWLVHVISPSTYDEARFQRLVGRMARHRVGVICCPSAAISMAQLRPERTPTCNSIARVTDFLAAGIPVRLGSDNLCDVTSPAGTPDLMAELFVLCNAMRFYDIEVLARLAAGVELDAACRARVAGHLRESRGAAEQALARLRKGQ